jgi:hypothetical protein
MKSFIAIISPYETCLSLVLKGTLLCQALSNGQNFFVNSLASGLLGSFTAVTRRGTKVLSLSSFWNVDVVTGSSRILWAMTERVL